MFEFARFRRLDSHLALQNSLKVDHSNRWIVQRPLPTFDAVFPDAGTSSVLALLLLQLVSYIRVGMARLMYM